MINEHVTSEEIRRFRAGALPLGEIRTVGNHIASCPDCSRLAQADPAARRTADALVQALGAFDDHPDADAIAAFVEERLPAEELSLLREHVEDCEQCSEDAEDLRMVARSRRRTIKRPRRVSRNAAFFFAAAATIAVIALLSLFSPPRREPRTIPTLRTSTVPKALPPKSGAIASAAWPQAVRSAIASGRLDPPPLFLELQQPQDAFRGEATGVRSGARLLDPVDEVVKTTRPTFRWAARSGARYRVVIAEHGRLAVRSRELREPEWQPEHDLIRGHAYEWQLEVIRDGVTTTVPVPPEPPVRFAVLGEREAAMLAEAGGANPDDHLLLGVLAAQAGLRREAESELRRAAQSPSTAESARPLLESIARWPRRPHAREREQEGS